MKPGEKRSEHFAEASCLFFFKPPIRSLKASFLLNARASIQCILFDTVRYTEHQPNLDDKKKTTSNYINNLYS
uniref:Uncharacterized protein n=1 Tax=Nelumbo nucifera TaxID=4432 RepID=A0A822Y241_NELNU|nr:TPA_asm: hypothetical protein HUJ06_027065 [Nelumbo nucifera]